MVSHFVKIKHVLWWFSSSFLPRLKIIYIYPAEGGFEGKGVWPYSLLILRSLLKSDHNQNINNYPSGGFCFMIL